MIYRADRADGLGKVEGGYFEKTPDIIITHAFYITDDESIIDTEFIKPETLEVFLFGEWRLVSELEKPCEWQLDKDDIEGDSWYTSCGQRDISFCTGDAKENKYKFCPYCGRPIKEI